MAKIYGRAIAVSGGAVPSIFGDGSDGDLIVRTGETFTIPVPVPHQSVVEKQYNSILIEAGGTLICDQPNAGLVLRCKGSCTIQGTIDQSCKAPKTNPNNNYDYPEELKCGDGGKGGDGYQVTGGSGMSARVYGGGYGGGGAGGNGSGVDNGWRGGGGGSADGITIDTPDSSMFLGGSKSYGSNAAAGQNGGGGGGAGATGNSYMAGGGDGGSGPGGNGIAGEDKTGAHAGGGGGAGNLGGGILLLYIGGEISMSGCTINCNGAQGGNGGQSSYGISVSGAGGGGGGGGAIYFVHYNPLSEGDILAMSLNANGGLGGTGRNSGAAGGLGSVTIKQYEKGMTK